MTVALCAHCGHHLDIHSKADGVCFGCSLAEGPCAVIVGIISDDDSLNRRIEAFAADSPSMSAGAPESTEIGIVCYLLMFPGNLTIDQAIGHLQSVLDVPVDQVLSLINPVGDVQVLGDTFVGPWDNQVLVLRTERRNG